MNVFNLTGNPNKSNRGTANYPPLSGEHIAGHNDWAQAPPRKDYHSTCKIRNDQAASLTRGFIELISSRKTIFLTS